MGCCPLLSQDMATVTDNFILTTPWPPPPEPVFYRLYHDEHGRPLFYSMADVPGTYIEIDQATYARSSMWVRVVDGKLVDSPWYVPQKLIPSDTGTLCHNKDISIVSSDGQGQYWRLSVDGKS